MSSLRDRWHRFRRAVRRIVLARRRLLAALCAGVAVLAGVRAATAPPPATVTVLAAAHDLAAGAVLTPDDLDPREFAPGSVPDGLAAEAVGRTLAAPVRAGEPITDVRLVGQDLADAHPELTTLPIRLPDAGLAALLEVGDRIDLIATDPEGGTTEVVASGVLVLATPRPETEPASGAPPGAVVVLGVPPASAGAVAEAAVRWFLSYAFTH